MMDKAFQQKEEKKNKFNENRDAKIRAKKEMQERNRYAAMISEKSVRRAKKFLETQPGS